MLVVRLLLKLSAPKVVICIRYFRDFTSNSIIFTVIAILLAEQF